jgi:hypothetical protein
MPFTGANMVMKAPAGMDNCADLHVYRDDDDATYTSLWRPTPEEISALLDGQPVCLAVHGSSHPPVMVWVMNASQQVRN